MTQSPARWFPQALMSHCEDLVCSESERGVVELRFNV
jgi:hypothetical protein